MPFQLPHNPGERFLFAQHLAPPAKKAAPFALALSNRALYLPRQKRFALSDPWYLEALPLGEVRAVSVHRHQPVWLFVLAAVMIIVGTLVLREVFSRPRDLHDAKAIGYSIAMIVVGLLVPFVVRPRRALTIDLVSSRFRWVPQITVGGPYARLSREFLTEFAMAARAAGLFVREE